MIYDNVFADATHLNFASRNKTISRINVSVDEINIVFLNTPLDICIGRNAKRKGRKFVPETVIKNMHNIYKNIMIILDKQHYLNYLAVNIICQYWLMVI